MWTPSQSTRKKATLVLLALLVAMVGASAKYLDNITDLLDEVPDIFNPILLIVVAVFPVIIVMILVKFMGGLFDGILGGIKGGIRF